MAQREGVTDPTWNGMNELDAGERKRRKYSPRPCPRCGGSTLVRHRRPMHLRILRLARIDIARYRCDTCSRRVSLRRH